MGFKFDNKTLDAVQSEINEAVAVIAKKHGFQAKPSRASYARDGSSCKFTVEAACANEDGVVLTPEAKAFYQLVKDQITYASICPVMGLKREHLGAEFEHREREFKVIGYFGRRPKMPILCQDVLTKRNYKFPLSILQKLDGVKVQADGSWA